jgi:hypothetical protein
MKVGIELSKAKTIMEHLGSRGKCTLQPGGVTVRFWKRATERGIRVYWQCFPRTSRAVSDSASSVTEAIKQVNAVLVPSEPSQTAEVIVMTAPTFPKRLPAPPVRQGWLPYKDAEL